MIRAASIGLGWWSDELAKSIQNRSELIRIASCYSRSAEKRAKFAAKFATETHDSFAAVLADPDIDAVILTTPHSLHAEHVCQAADAGKHVFVEKPFALTAESGRKAASSCEAAGVVLAVGHNRRFSAAGKKLQSLLSNGDFGTLLHLETNFSAPGALAYTPDKWRANRTESPAGGIAGLGIHMIDLLCWIAGPIRHVRAQATRRAVSVDIDDTTSALFEFSSGATGYLGCSFACPYTTIFNIYGTAANAFSDIDGEVLYTHVAGETPEPLELEPVDTLREELDEFAAACDGNGRFRVFPSEAVCNVAIMEAIAKSAIEGTVIEIDPESRSAWTEAH